MMIKAVLLDLDDTLLSNPDHTFIPAYLQEIDRYFDEALGLQAVSQTVLAATVAMTSSTDYTQTNLSIASKTIADALGYDEVQLEPHYATFYKEHFPRLRRLTNTVDITYRLVQQLQDRGLAVVIATNPLYPADAIYQRLEWAGISPFPDDYDWVTTANNMHFTKPSPMYYAEILARVGIEPHEAIMVGNSLENDILPAKQLGLHTFHVTSSRTATVSDSSGPLDTFSYCVEQGWLDSLLKKPLSPDMIEPELAGNLAALFGLLSEVQEHQWTQHPLTDEWSIQEIVCHLLEYEGPIQRAQLQQIFNEDSPFIRAVMSENTMPICDDKDGMELAHKFAQDREETLDLLRTLTPSDWQRPAQHSVFSNTTLLEMAHFMAQHDRMHITQICQTLGHCD